MKNDMTGLLNLAYEIEGLLLLQINRGDEASPEMKQLLVSKARKLVEDLTSDETPAEPSCVVAAPASAEPAPAIAEPAPVAVVETVIVPEEAALPEDAPAPEAVAEEAPAPVAEPEPSQTCEAQRASDAEAVAENALREESEDAMPRQLTLEEKLARDRAADISKAFTLNDRFRFRRNLFHDSDEEFRETLDVIGSMSGMDEAEEYFYEDLCWDADNDDVKEFMAVVAKHF